MGIRSHPGNGGGGRNVTYIDNPYLNLKMSGNLGTTYPSFPPPFFTLMVFLIGFPVRTQCLGDLQRPYLHFPVTEASKEMAPSKM